MWPAEKCGPQKLSAEFHRSSVHILQHKFSIHIPLLRNKALQSTESMFMSVTSCIFSQVTPFKMNAKQYNELIVTWQ